MQQDQPNGVNTAHLPAPARKDRKDHKDRKGIAHT